MPQEPLLEQLQDGDPRTVLAAIKALREQIKEHEARAVRLGRAEGMSWEEIARVLGRRRSTVWQRYHYDEDEVADGG